MEMEQVIGTLHGSNRSLKDSWRRCLFVRYGTRFAAMKIANFNPHLDSAAGTNLTSAI